MKTIFGHPTLQECIIIANGISEENKKSPHMMQVNPESLYQYSQLQTGYGIFITNILAGFIKIMPIGENIYEWGSLFVLEQFRGQGLSNSLIQHILTVHHNKALICVTNVPQVKKACKRYEQDEFKKEDMADHVLGAIESGQALLHDDHIFGNKNFLKIAKI